MPFKDQTGPLGNGAMTGRGLGLCHSDDEKADNNPQLPSGLGARRMGRFASQGKGKRRHRRQNLR